MAEWGNGIDELETWEIWPGESAEAYAAFCAYRDLPPGKRTLAAAAERAGFERTESQRERREAPGAIRQWAREFCWRERTRDYELHCDRERRAVSREQVRALAQEHAEAGAKVRRKILHCIDQLFTEELVPAHMVRSLATCIDIERQALGALDEPAWAEQDRLADAERADMLDQLCRRQAETIHNACSTAADPASELERVIANLHQPTGKRGAKEETAATVRAALDRYQAGTPEERTRWLDDPKVRQAVNYFRSRGIALPLLFAALLAATSALALESASLDGSLPPSGNATARPSGNQTPSPPLPPDRQVSRISEGGERSEPVGGAEGMDDCWTSLSPPTLSRGGGERKGARLTRQSMPAICPLLPTI